MDQDGAVFGIKLKLKAYVGMQERKKESIPSKKLRHLVEGLFGNMASCV